MELKALSFGIKKMGVSKTLIYRDVVFEKDEMYMRKDDQQVRGLQEN